MLQEKHIIVRYTIRPLPAKVFSTEKLRLDLLGGRIPLSYVPKKFRLRNKTFYIHAFRYYRYKQDITSPFEILRSDYESLPDGYEKQRLVDLYDQYNYTLNGVEPPSTCLSQTIDSSRTELSACIEEADALMKKMKERI
ncbi:hypothetical protein RBH76_10650 [Oscillospiraceae bacterium MB24-C1]|nr:hypothetical protein RBH76_10650 [Oscillospiraceae bacterium MB24-C1]